MDTQSCVYLGIKVKPGPIERFKIENFGLENTVDLLKDEAGKKANVPSDTLELIHHGKILKHGSTLQESGIKNGEMVHAVMKKSQPAPEVPPTYTDAELLQIVTALRTFGSTPNAPGWIRAMQLLNNSMSEIIEAVPSLADECITLSMLHEVELLSALGTSVHTMRRVVDARPNLLPALRILTRLVRSRSGTSLSTHDPDAPISGFAYSLEALSEDEDADEEETEETERSVITQEQLAAALQAATETETTSSPRNINQDAILRLLQGASGESSRRQTSDSASPAATTPGTGGATIQGITPQMFSEAIRDAIIWSRAAPDQPAAQATGTPMEQSAAASSSQSPVAGPEESYGEQLRHMREMGLLDDVLNLRALLICSGDVNAAINLVFSGAIGDD